jgi:hypothetical protein
MTFAKFSTGLVALFLLAGCSHSHVIKVNVINNSTDKLSNIIIDYPTATFGIRSLAPEKTFQYSIKPTDSGALKIEFTDAQGKIKNFPGPSVHKDDEGTIEIRLTQDTALAETKLLK